MNDNINETLNFYCENEVANFKNHKLYNDLFELVNKLDFHLVCEYCKKDDKKNQYFYLNIEVRNGDEIVSEVDEPACDLTMATALIIVDRKKRIKFFPWTDEDFIDSINLIMKDLQRRL